MAKLGLITLSFGDTIQYHSPSGDSYACLNTCATLAEAYLKPLSFGTGKDLQLTFTANSCTIKELTPEQAETPLILTMLKILSYIFIFPVILTLIAKIAARLMVAESLPIPTKINYAIAQAILSIEYSEEEIPPLCTPS